MHPGMREKSKWGILAVTVMSPFMSTLDANIVNVALPVMAQKLHVTSAMIAWVASAYLITLTASMLFFGKLGDLKGQTKVLQYGLLGFTLGSALCSLSPSFGFLIFARVVQALGAAATMANSQGIISRTFPKNELGRALGINGAFVALGSLTGPSLGGFVISFAGWQTLFWINVPIGLIAFIGGFFLYPKEESSHGLPDPPGTALFALSMVTLFLAVQEGQSVGFGSPLILASLAVAAISFGAFLYFQIHRENRLLDLGIFRSKWFSISIFCSFTSFIAISCYAIVLPFYLQDVLRMSPSHAGLIMTIYPLLLIVASPVSGALSDRIGAEGLTLIGLSLTCFGMFLMATLSESTPIYLTSAFIVCMAVGNGLFQSPNNSIVMTSLPQEQLGVGGSVNALVRTLGQTAGTAASTALLYAGMSWKLGRHVTDYIPGQNGAFLFGMRIAYLTAGVICLVGAGITAARLYQRRLRRTAGA